MSRRGGRATPRTTPAAPSEVHEDGASNSKIALTQDSASLESDGQRGSSDVESPAETPEVPKQVDEGGAKAEGVDADLETAVSEKNSEVVSHVEDSELTDGTEASDEQELTASSGASADEVPDVEPRSEEVPESGQAHQALVDLNEMRTGVSHAEEALTKSQRKAVASRARRDEAAALLSVVGNSRNSLAAWIDSRSQSMALRLLDAMNREQQRLQHDEDDLATWASAEIPLEPERVWKLRQKYLRALAASSVSSAGIGVIAGLIWATSRHNGAVWLWVLTFLWVFFAVAMVALVLSGLGVLKWYHRAYSGLRSELARELTRGEGLLGGLENVRRERARLDGLYPQVTERLAFLSALLHSPWQVPESIADLLPRNPDPDKFPALLQVAVASGTHSGEGQLLLRRFLAKSVEVGSKRQAAQEILVAAARAQGIDEAAISLSMIDRETSPRGLRASILDAIEDGGVLQDLGRKRITEVAEVIQQGLGLQAERPPVRPMNHNNLAEIRVTNDLLSPNDDVILKWDDHLGTIKDPSTALSQLAFSAVGRTRGAHITFDSVVVAPRRLFKDADIEATFLPTDEKVFTGAEVAARVDITPPLPIEQVALFMDAPNAVPLQAPTQEESTEFFL